MDRIASKLKVPGHIYPVHTLLFTLPGIPSVYYGSEWGIQGKKEGSNDDFLRPAVNLEEALEEIPDPKLLSWIKTLGKIRRDYQALSDGVYQELLLTNRQYAFARILGNEGVIVAVNNDEQEAQLRIRVPQSGKTCVSLLDGSVFDIQGDAISVCLQPNESQIIEMK